MSTDNNIPPSAKPLLPYIRSRQEVHRIRQTLTLYLQSHIVSACDDEVTTPANTNDTSHVSLGVPIDPSASVKRVPSNLTGVRKEYLKALQENAAARREYDELSNRIAFRRPPAQDNLTSTKGHDTPPLHDYLSSIREDRRYEKLRLFDNSLKRLTGATKPDGYVADEEQQNTLLDQEKLESFWNGLGSSRESNEGVQALISKLERTVLRAKAKLAREQNLLKELKARQLSEDVSNNPSRRVIALQCVRDELVQWVEEKLVTANSGEAAEFGESPKKNTASSQAVEERKGEIREQYAKYLQERRLLLEALSLVSQPTKSTTPAAERCPKGPSEPVVTNTAVWNSIDLFGPASELLLPGSTVQRSLALQRSYLTGLLSKEKTNLKQALERLSHESHLLPEYPILARHSKFKHISNNAGGRTDRTEGDQTDELLQKAQAWAFASEAASTHEGDYVEQRIEHGLDMSESASRTLQQVYGLLNQENNAAAEDTALDEGNETDIWVGEVESHRPRRRRQKNDQQPGNPWARLNGNVGFSEG
ncbi:hypothetical protein BGW36DRAFT_375633 [Talaromyces proteolyticus]|uniref:Uncharacterized protein n=1 Tax=Talaromyces proteolyticus TaxID=1131652 RepID=A0AAD4L1E7_9EURO|nr:uncharacterized protein BGW36DRAFT_375633 [Talaromyces proteolyticus]KAH8701129.1 hypothetical protein BGW36DRAFT_375633 [Talaromyces proteolyticus]